MLFVKCLSNKISDFQPFFHADFLVISEKNVCSVLLADKEATKTWRVLCSASLFRVGGLEEMLLGKVGASDGSPASAPTLAALTARHHQCPFGGM